VATEDNLRKPIASTSSSSPEVSRPARTVLFPSTPVIQNQASPPSPSRDVDEGDTTSPQQQHQGTYSPALDDDLSPEQRPDEPREVHGEGIRSPTRAPQVAANSPSPLSRSRSGQRNRVAIQQTFERSQSPPRARFPLITPENDIRRNFHPDLGPLTKVLDVPFELFGSLCGTANPIRFIPEKHVERTRVLFTTIIKRITDHHDPCSNDPQLLLAYKKFFFFIILISNNAGKSKDIKTYIEWVLDLISRDEWDSFTLGGLQMRSFHMPTEQTDDDRRWKASKSLANGRLSKGYQEWVKPRPFIPQNDDVFDSLTSLFPEPAPSFLNPAEQLRFQQRVTELENAPQDVEPASIDRVGKIIMSRPNLIKSGFDHLTPEFVKKCWGMKSDQRQVDFRKVFTLLVNLVRSARIPEAVRPMFCDTEAFAIPKKDGNIRPLGTCNFIRKVAGAVSLKDNSSAMGKAFSDVQLGFERHGTEKIIHSVRLCTEVHREYDAAFPDGINAFNNSSREAALDTAIVETPGMFPLLKMLYGQVSKSWFAGCQDGIRSIKCKEGSIQGCTFGPLECALAYLKLFRMIFVLICVGYGISKAFFDDLNMVTTFDKLLEALSILITEGPKCGYKIHYDKGDFLLGVANSLELALERKQQLIDLGFKPKNIKIHPDDIALGSDLEVRELGFDDFEEARLAYGSRVLGGYIGDSLFIQAQLRAKAEELEAEADRLIELGDPQKCYLFARYCFSEKDNHIYRTTYPHLVREFAERVDQAKKKILCKGILGGYFDVETLPEWVWTQACFTINDGGLGLKDSVLTSHAAFVASVADCFPELDKSCPGFMSQDIPFVRAFNDSLQFISSAATASDRDQVRRLSLEDVLALPKAPGNQSKRGGLQYLLCQLMDDAIRKRFKTSLTPKHGMVQLSRL